MLAPNKQNLLLLGSQKKTMQSGYKLLKEKQTGLILTFLDLAREGKRLEQKLNSDLQLILSKYQQSLTFVSSQELLLNLPPVPGIRVKTGKKRISGVWVEDIQVEGQTPLRKQLKPEITASLTLFPSYFPLLIQLSTLKINCLKIAQEIQKVNRQISNLDQKIENLIQETKKIQNILSERENLEKAVLIKLFG
jgi:vacuolar-type H+-ATPase subunit D/Vma8